MSIPETINDLFNDKKDMDIKQKIVEELLNNKNLDTKTELSRPLRWSCMSTLTDYLDVHTLPISTKILKNFTNISFRYLISNDRKGRNEYIEALKHLSGMDKQNPLPNTQLMG